jgi:hypothetical protein
VAVARFDRETLDDTPCLEQLDAPSIDGDAPVVADVATERDDDVAVTSGDPLERHRLLLAIDLDQPTRMLLRERLEKRAPLARFDLSDHGGERVQTACDLFAYPLSVVLMSLTEQVILTTKKSATRERSSNEITSE